MFLISSGQDKLKILCIRDEHLTGGEWFQRFLLVAKLIVPAIQILLMIVLAQSHLAPGHPHQSVARSISWTLCIHIILIVGLEAETMRLLDQLYWNLQFENILKKSRFHSFLLER